MCANEINAPVELHKSHEQKPFGLEKEALKSYYLKQIELMFPTLSNESSEKQKLWTLHRKTKQMIKLLTTLDRCWEEGVPDVQKACLFYLMSENIPRKQRHRVIEAWGLWTNFFITISGQKTFTVQMLQSFHNQLKHLEFILCNGSNDLNEEVVKQI